MEHSILEQRNIPLFAVPRCQVLQQEGKLKQRKGLISKIFSYRKKHSMVKRVKSPLVRNMQVRKSSPKRNAGNIFMVTEGDGLHNLNDDELQNGSSLERNGIFQGNDDLHRHGEENLIQELDYTMVRPQAELVEKEKLIERIRRKIAYLEAVKVVDKGTDPFKPEETTDKSTDPLIPGDSDCFQWTEDKVELVKSFHEKELEIEKCLKEGNLLLEDLQKLQETISSNSKHSNLIQILSPRKGKTPSEFLHWSRQCLIELGFLVLSEQNRHESDVQKLKCEIDSEKKTTCNLETQIKVLKKKFGDERTSTERESENVKQLESKSRSLQESLEMGKRVLKENEKVFKAKIENLERDICSQKQQCSGLVKEIKEKNDLVSRLEVTVEKLQSALQASKQEMREMQQSRKSKLAKIELEHTNKIAAMCENQTLTNKQLTHALNQSSHYTNQFQGMKKENISLISKNKSLNERVVNMERELGKLQERSLAAERRLSRETQEVMSLKDQLSRLEATKEEELLCIDGDIWCQIMYQQDQFVLDDLRVSLQEKEQTLETLRAQGDCSLNDFEKEQNELQQRRIQFTELKDVFLEFQKKRDNVVREQREFYNKMFLLSKPTISREKFFKNLIEELQSKSKMIEELEIKLNNANNAFEETNKTSEAQLKAMQIEINFTAERLYEFENQIRMKDAQLQDVIKVLENEKHNKFVAEEAMKTYKLQLEDAKKENFEMRNNVNYLKDIEKNKVNLLREVEQLAKETQKRHDTENKLKKIQQELADLKIKIDSKEDVSSQPERRAKGNSKEVEHLRKKIHDLAETKKYVERILLESQRSKEALQKDHEELCSKMRYAVKVMVESKKNQEALELKLDERRHLIQDLQKSQEDTEDRLDDLKDVLHEMQETIDVLHTDREELKEELLNHSTCKAERVLHQELKLLQRDKSIMEDQYRREKEMLLRRVKDNEDIMKDQHKHLRALQDQLESLSAQLRDTKNQLATERHNHTQQTLSLQAEKKKLELYIQELEARLTIETRLRMQVSDSLSSSPKFISSDSYEPPNRDYPKSNFYKK